MPLWLIAAIILAAAVAGAAGERAWTAAETQSLAYGQHSHAHAKTTVAELVTQARRSPQPPPGCAPPPAAWDDTDEIPVIPIYTDPVPPRGGDVAARILKGFHDARTA